MEPLDARMGDEIRFEYIIAHEQRLITNKRDWTTRTGVRMLRREPAVEVVRAVSVSPLDVFEDTSADVLSKKDAHTVSLRLAGVSTRNGLRLAVLHGAETLSSPAPMF